MQYPQQTPNIMIVGDSALLEKIALAYRLDLKVSRVLRRIAPLLMLLVLALHFVAWQFLVAVRVEYGYAVIGLGVLALAIFSTQYLGPQAPAQRWLNLGLRLLYALSACYLMLEYSEVDYLPAIDYLQHLQVRRHLFAPLVASVLICALGLLITAPVWGESKLQIYALALALGACWIAYASNVNSSLVINTRPEISAQASAQAAMQASAPAQTQTQTQAPAPAPAMRRKSEDSVLNARDIQALSEADTPATLNNRVRSRINAERNLCLVAALVAFSFCLVCVWTFRTWLQGHGIHTQRDFFEIVRYLKERPNPYGQG